MHLSLESELKRLWSVSFMMQLESGNRAASVMMGGKRTAGFITQQSSKWKRVGSEKSSGRCHVMISESRAGVKNCSHIFFADVQMRILIDGMFFHCKGNMAIHYFYYHQQSCPNEVQQLL